MQVLLNCPECVIAFMAVDAIVGQHVKCPQCGARFLVPPRAGLPPRPPVIPSKDASKSQKPGLPDPVSAPQPIWTADPGPAALPLSSKGSTSGRTKRLMEIGLGAALFVGLMAIAISVLGRLYLSINEPMAKFQPDKVAVQKTTDAPRDSEKARPGKTPIPKVTPKSATNEHQKQTEPTERIEKIEEQQTNKDSKESAALVVQPNKNEAKSATTEDVNTQEKDKVKDRTAPFAESLKDPETAKAVEQAVAFLNAKAVGLKDLPNIYNSGHSGFDSKVMRPGVAGLMGFTLLECGAAPNDPAVLRIADIIRTETADTTKIYVLAASLFFLNRWNESLPQGLETRDRTVARSLALRIIAGQMNSGPWFYEGILLAPSEEASLLADLAQENYQPNNPSVTYSMSNTQFAMLALWGARKHGIPVRNSLLAAAKHFHTTQAVDGHWAYSNTAMAPGWTTNLWATSTCAGLLALAMEAVLLEDKEFKTKGFKNVFPTMRADPATALDFVAKSIGRKKGDGGAGIADYAGTLFQADAWGDLYFLWSVERVAMIYGKSQIGGKDWYNWGCPIILKAQQSDGSWKDRHDPLVDTCFALLFLKRANIARDLTNMLMELRGIVVEKTKK